MFRNAAWVKFVTMAAIVCGSIGITDVSAAGRVPQRHGTQGMSGGSNGAGQQQQAVNRVRAQAAQLQAQEHARFVAKRRAAAIAKGNLPGAKSTTAK